MSDDRSAAAGMEELQKTRQEMKDLKTRVNTAEDRLEEVAKKAGGEAGRGTVKTAHIHSSHQAKVLAPRFTRVMTLVSPKSQVSAWHKIKVVNWKFSLNDFCIILKTLLNSNYAKL